MTDLFNLSRVILWESLARVFLQVGDVSPSRSRSSFTREELSAITRAAEELGVTPARTALADAFKRAAFDPSELYDSGSRLVYVAKYATFNAVTFGTVLRDAAPRAVRLMMDHPTACTLLAIGGGPLSEVTQVPAAVHSVVVDLPGWGEWATCAVRGDLPRLGDRSAWLPVSAQFVAADLRHGLPPLERPATAPAPPHPWITVIALSYVVSELFATDTDGPGAAPPRCDAAAVSGDGVLCEQCGELPAPDALAPLSIFLSSLRAAAACMHPDGALIMLERARLSGQHAIAAVSAAVSSPCRAMCWRRCCDGDSAFTPPPCVRVTGDGARVNPTLDARNIAELGRFAHRLGVTARSRGESLMCVAERRLGDDIGGSAS